MVNAIGMLEENGKKLSDHQQWTMRNPCGLTPYGQHQHHYCDGYNEVQHLKKKKNSKFENLSTPAKSMFFMKDVLFYKTDFYEMKNKLIILNSKKLTLKSDYHIFKTWK